MNVIPRFTGEHSFLSNFHESPIKIDQAKFPTGEHAFQACKSKAITQGAYARDGYIAGCIMAKTPGEAKKLGRSVKINLALWESIKVECMREVVWAKFTQNDDLRKQLLATGHAMLVEGNTWGDTFWGRCEGKGSNILGVILMEIRGFYHWQTNAPVLRTNIGPSQHPIN